MKDKLIKLFEENCLGYAPKSSDTRHWKIQSFAHDKVKVILAGLTPVGYKYEYSSYNEYYDYGFNFNSQPSLHLYTTKTKWSRRYGKFVFIISYFFLNNYRKRKEYLKEAKSLVEQHDYLDYTYTNNSIEPSDKFVNIKGMVRFIVHGSLVYRISEAEYERLNKLYVDNIEAYDEYMLNLRLKKDE